MRGLQGARAYFARELLELVVLIGVLVVFEHFYTLPVPVWIGLPIGKALFSVLFYFIFLRRMLSRRPHHAPDRLVGKVGIVVSRLAPEGQIRIQGEIWSAISRNTGAVASGREVRVQGLEGRRLIVETTDHKS